MGRGAARGHHRLGYVITAVLLAAGLASFVTARATVHDLDASLDAFYTHTRFADLTIVGGQADAFAAAARTHPGVDAVNVRHTTTLSVFLHGGKTKVQGTIIGVPDGQPAIDVPQITEGQGLMDQAAPVAIAEQHTAEDLELHPGDHATALGLGDQAVISVAGVGLSPEYLLPAQSQQQIVASPGSFAVLFVPDALAVRLGGAAAVPEALVRYAPGADRASLDARLTRIATRYRASLVEPRDRQPSNALVAEVRTALDEAGIVIPALLLMVALFVGALACARVAERRVRIHRMIIASTAGALGGAALGFAVSRGTGPAFTDALHVPTHVAAGNGWAALVGMAVVAIVGLVAYGLGSLLARALTDDVTLGAGPAFVTAVAAAASIVCVVAPVGVVDSAQATLVAADRLERVDAQVAFAARVGGTELSFLHGVPGVAAAEPVPSANIVVGHGDHRYVTSLEAFRADTTMQTFETQAGTPFVLPRHGAVIPRALGHLLHADVGDDLEIALPGAGVGPLHVPVAAFTSDTLGNLVFLRISALRDALGADAGAFAGGLFNTATIRFAAGADAAAIARRVQAEPSVVVYVPVAAALNSVSTARPTLRAITDALLVVGMVVIVLGLAGAVVLHARTRRARGTLRLTLEVLAAVTTGIVVGTLVGTFAANRLVGALDTDLVHLTREIDGSTYLFAIGIVAVASAAALLFGMVTSSPAAVNEDGQALPVS